MRNPFLIIRFVFFSLMIYMTILTIVFASWNIATTMSSGLSAPGASVFVILNGCALFAFIAAGFAELLSSNSKTANVTFECGWTAIFSTLELGAAVTITISGPAIQCQPETTWDICVSSHLLVPVSWLSSFAVVVYFLTLFGTAIAHMHSYPSVWRSSVYSMPWFVSPTPNDPVATTPTADSKPTPAPSPASRDSFIVMRFLRNRSSTKMDDVENNISEPILFPRKSNGLLGISPPPNMPGWVQRAASRRGLDTPFTRKDDSDEYNMETVELAEPQPRVAQLRRGVDQPFTTKADDPTVPPAVHIADNLPVPYPDTRPLSPLQRKRSVSPVFKNKVDNQDAPIPLPKHSEWIRADSKFRRALPRQ